VLKPPISISFGTSMGIMTFRALIRSESDFPSPLVSTVYIDSLGGKIFLKSTFRVDIRDDISKDMRIQTDKKSIFCS
jgi:hypothetical protein